MVEVSKSCQKNQIRTVAVDRSSDINSCSRSSSDFL